MTKSLSRSGLKALLNSEGFRANAYQDDAGVWTIGYGTTKGVQPGDKITKEAAFKRAKEELFQFENAINKLVQVHINQNQYDALVNFVYNVGIGAFRTSTLLKKLNVENYLAAADQFLKWKYVTKDGKKTESQGLLNRRIRERELFLKKDEGMTVKEVVKETAEVVAEKTGDVVQKTNSMIDNFIVRTLFERIPGFKKFFSFFDGYKTTLGRLILFVSGLSTLAIEVWPDNVIIGSGASMIGLVTGWLITELGLRHASDKEGRGIDK